MVKFSKRVGVLAAGVALLVTIAVVTGGQMPAPMIAFRGACAVNAMCIADANRAIMLAFSRVSFADGDWLPDLSAAVFTTPNMDDPYSNKLVRYNGATHQMTEISTDGTVKSFASWSPDRAHVAYMLWEADNEQIRLQIVAADGTPLNDPLPITGSTARNITWSPNGKRLLFNATAGPYSRLIYIYDLNRAPAREVCEGPTGHASWSPDSTQVVCATRRRDGDYLQFVNAGDGSTHRMALVTEPPNAVLFPVWSPDGEQIAYVEQQPGAAHYLRVFDRATGEHRPASDMRFGALSEPMWLDDTRILQASQSFFLVVNTQNNHTRTLHPNAIHDFYGRVVW